MKHIIEIDDSTKRGKQLVEILKILSKKGEEIEFKSINDIDTLLEKNEDESLGRMIEEGLESGIANKEEVLKKLGL
ncbi:MAG: hypothetical protein K9I94_02250 [Bacteroidales bacterium]|nr:hypothetical protein [Bacteroidales bacterium]